MRTFAAAFVVAIQTLQQIVESVRYAFFDDLVVHRPQLLADFDGGFPAQAAGRGISGSRSLHWFVRLIVTLRHFEPLAAVRERRHPPPTHSVGNAMGNKGFPWEWNFFLPLGLGI